MRLHPLYTEQILRAHLRVRRPRRGGGRPPRAARRPRLPPRRPGGPPAARRRASSRWPTSTRRSPPTGPTAARSPRETALEILWKGRGVGVRPATASPRSAMRPQLSSTSRSDASCDRLRRLPPHERRRNLRHRHDLRHRPPQPRHGLDRLGHRLRRAARAGSTRRTRYVPVRLGELNAQTRWALERSGAPEPELLRPRDAARARRDARRPSRAANHNDSLRDVGVAMAKGDVDLIPIVDDDGAIVGHAHRARPGPPLHQGVGRAVELRRPAGVGRPDRRGAGRARCWCAPAAPPERPPVGRHGRRGRRMGSTMGANDIVVVGNRADAQRRAVEIGVALVVSPYDGAPDEEVLEAGAPQRAPASCSRPSTPTSPAGWCPCRCPCAR